MPRILATPNTKKQIGTLQEFCKGNAEQNVERGAVSKKRSSKKVGVSFWVNLSTLLMPRNRSLKVTSKNWGTQGMKNIGDIIAKVLERDDIRKTRRTTIFTTFWILPHFYPLQHSAANSNYCKYRGPPSHSCIIFPLSI